jgi:hypothetical protein
VANSVVRAAPLAHLLDAHARCGRLAGQGTMDLSLLTPMNRDGIIALGSKSVENLDRFNMETL